MLPIVMVMMMLIIISISANHNNWAEPKCGHSMLSSYVFGYLQPRITSMLKWIQIWICHTGRIIIIIIILVCHAYESKVVCHAYKFKVAMTWPLTMSLSGPLRASKRLNCYSTYHSGFIYHHCTLSPLWEVDLKFSLKCFRSFQSSASNSKCSFANIFDLLNSFKAKGLWQNLSQVLNIFFPLSVNIEVVTFIPFKHALVNVMMPEG